MHNIIQLYEYLNHYGGEDQRPQPLYDDVGFWT